MNYRDWLQQLIYKIINPVVHGMIKVGITPNFITTTGLVMNIVAACVFVYAGMYKPGELAYVGWGGGIVLFAGLFDMMDGRVARVGNMSSTFGALYDSVLDAVRYFLLSDFARVSVGIDDYFCRIGRFAYGELCACTCRRIGTGM